MPFEGQLTVEARKVKPEARIRFESNSLVLTMFWEWEYKGQQLSYDRAELRKDYDEDPELVGSVIDFSMNQIGVIEKGIDDARP